MKFKAFETEYDNKKFIIKEDNPEVGVYLYIYEDDKDIADYLQNDIETCKRIAFKKFRVPMDSWKVKVEPD